jgi:hypothetical protein
MGGGGGTSTLDEVTISTAVSTTSSGPSSRARDAFAVLASALFSIMVACWPDEAAPDAEGTAPGGNLNSRSMVPCLVRGWPLFFEDFVSDAESWDSPPSPLSSGVGSKVLRIAFDGDSEFADDVGSGDVGVRDGAGIEARLAAFAAWVL